MLMHMYTHGCVVVFCIGEIKTNKRLQVMQRKKVIKVFCLFFLDLCKQTNVNEGAGITVITKQSVLVHFILCLVGNWDPSKYQLHSLWQELSCFFLALCLISNYLQALNCDIFLDWRCSLTKSVREIRFMMACQIQRFTKWVR